MELFNTICVSKKKSFECRHSFTVFPNDVRNVERFLMSKIPSILSSYSQVLEYPFLQYQKRIGD